MPIAAFHGANAFDAWQQVATYLAALPGSRANNVVVEIENPGDWNDSWFERINPRAVHDDGENPANVANTIFPLSTWRNSAGRDDLYRRYRIAHRRGRNKRWGTYFLRLIAFGASEVNQLERGINVLNTWKNEPGTAIVFHLSSPETDRPRALGAPCLQLLQLQAWEGRVSMTAIYRSHDYFNKALANFVGLGRLLNFVCKETGHDIGRIVCHSGHAFCSEGKGTMTRLLARA